MQYQCGIVSLVRHGKSTEHRITGVIQSGKVHLQKNFIGNRLNHHCKCDIVLCNEPYSRRSLQQGESRFTGSAKNFGGEIQSR